MEATQKIISYTNNATISGVDLNDQHDKSSNLDDRGCINDTDKVKCTIYCELDSCNDSDDSSDSYSESKSSDLDEMTEQVKIAEGLSQPSFGRDHSLSSSKFSTAQSKKCQQEKPKQICYFKEVNNSANSISSKQNFSMADPMQSPQQIPKLIRKISTVRFSEIATQGVTANKYFVQKNVILRKLEIKHATRKEYLAPCERLNNKPSNYRFNRKTQAVVHLVRYQAGHAI